jgi:hypothetical protein
MNIDILICQNTSLTSNDSIKYIITFIASLTVALIIFFSTIIKDRLKAKRETRERLRREIYFICEKLLSHAIYASKRALETRYYYSMHKIAKDEDFDKSNYSKYLNDAESAILSASLCQVELKSKIKELEYLNGKDIKDIGKLVSEDGEQLIKRYDGFFNKNMTKDEIQNNRDVEMKKIVNYTKEISIGKNLVEIQKLIYPILTTILFA